MTATCDLCHEDTLTVYPWRCYWVCLSCRDYGDYYDNLTPGEREAEEASVASYCHHEYEKCDCQHRHRPVKTVRPEGKRL